MPATRPRACKARPRLPLFCAVSDLGAPIDFSTRKSDHLDLTIAGDVGFRRTTLLEQVELVHSALPELDFASISLEARIAGKKVRSPLVIASMTGGNERAGDINLRLAEVAERGGYALGLGSQRAMIKTGKIDPKVAESYQLRKVAPTAPIFGNIGVVQASRMSTAFVEEMLSSVGADALFVHLNPAQEMTQEDGDRDFRGGLDTLTRLSTELRVPVIAKETGCGLSRTVARALAERGIRHVDVSGAGGTSWVAVETHRATGDLARQGREFWNWGIPTAASILQVRTSSFETVIATGGIKSGLDVARAIALGASAAGIARPVLQAVEQGGVEGALAFLSSIERDLQTAMLLTGSPDLGALGRAPRVLGPELRAWSEA